MFRIWQVKVWRRYGEDADFAETTEVFGVGTLEEAVELLNEIEEDERVDLESGFLDCFTVEIKLHEYEGRVRK